MSLIIFLPTVAALVASLLPPKEQDETMKQFSLITTIMVFALTVWSRYPCTPQARHGRLLARSRPDADSETFRPWIPAFGINYHLGLDGISLPLVVLTSFLSVLAMWTSWPIQKHVRGLLHPLPAPGDGHAGRVHVAGLLPVLRLLGSDAPADVLSDRRVGRAAAGVRGHQVLPLYARRQRAHADRPVDALLRQRPAAEAPS